LQLKVDKDKKETQCCCARKFMKYSL